MLSTRTYFAMVMYASPTPCFELSLRCQRAMTDAVPATNAKPARALPPTSHVRTAVGSMRLWASPTQLQIVAIRYIGTWLGNGISISTPVPKAPVSGKHTPTIRAPAYLGSLTRMSGETFQCGMETRIGHQLSVSELSSGRGRVRVQRAR